MVTNPFPFVLGCASKEERNPLCTVVYIDRSAACWSTFSQILGCLEVYLIMIQYSNLHTHTHTLLFGFQFGFAAYTTDRPTTSCSLKVNYWSTLLCSDQNAELVELWVAFSNEWVWR